MSKYMVDGTDLTSIADAIRTKTGGSSQIEFPTEFVSNINGISTVPEIKTVTFALALSSSKTSVTIGLRGGSLNYIVQGNPPAGKMWILKKCNSLSIFNVSQTLNDFCLDQDFSSNAVIRLYSATGSNITVNRPSYGANQRIELNADVFEVSTT